MITALAVTLAMAQTPIAQPQRLRATLPNGTGALVENMPGAKQFSVQLIAGAQAAKETPATHGWRHLLEHLMARGKNLDLDARLESKGLFLLPDTTRDYMVFEILGSQAHLDLALDAIKELLEPPVITTEEIAQETKTLEQELALLSDSSKLGSKCWVAAFGESNVLDSLGDIPTIATATPEALVALHQTIFRDGNLVLSITGPSPLDETMDKAKALMGSIKRLAAPVQKLPPAVGSPNKVTSSILGSARGALVPGLPAKDTIQTLVTGLVITSTDPSFQITYTPSEFPGLVIITSPSAALLKEKIDDLAESSIDELYPMGSIFGGSWLKTVSEDPSMNARLRGILMFFRRDLRLEDILDTVKGMTLKDFKAAFAKFKADQAARVN